MISRLRMSFMSFLLMVIVAWIGYRSFRYFTHSAPPVVTVDGLVESHYYGGTLNASIKADTGYKVATITGILDGKNIFEERIGSRHFSHPFSIDTNLLSDGVHTLILKTTDASFHKNNAEQAITFYIDNTPLRAIFVENNCIVDQGKTAHIKIQANKKIGSATLELWGKSITLYPAGENAMIYETFLPIDCERQPSESLGSAVVTDMVGNSTKLDCKVTIRAFTFQKQKGFSVDQTKLNQEKEISLNSRILQEAISRWALESPKKKLWTGLFELPVNVKKITTPHGEIRATPERGRYLHKGIDLINTPKCVVWASQDGKVIIKDRYHITGNTVVIDHGLGVMSLYAHLEEYADIEVGDSIKKGNPVGKMGKTGYATGYHLHWEIIVNSVSVDPLEWTTRIS